MGDAFQIGKFYFECFIDIEVKEKQLVCSTHFPKWWNTKIRTGEVGAQVVWHTVFSYAHNSQARPNNLKNTVDGRKPKNHLVNNGINFYIPINWWVDPSQISEPEKPYVSKFHANWLPNPNPTETFDTGSPPTANSRETPLPTVLKMWLSTPFLKEKGKCCSFSTTRVVVPHLIMLKCPSKIESDLTNWPLIK